MDAMLYPLKWAVAWVMVHIHNILVFLGMHDGPGFAWVLSIVGLTVVVRILIMPLFFKQIRASRGMQLMQPEMRALQEKYKGKKDPESKRRQQEEMMALYKKHGSNPMASCFPILIQMPIFFALFRVLARLQDVASGKIDPIGPLTASLADDVQHSNLFGASLSESFMQASTTEVKIVTIVLIIAMGVTQFLTMRQLTMKNMPESAKNDDNPMMRSQKSMMYIMPVIFAVTGVQFQIGVLIYWLTTNLWTMGQQFFAIHRMPAPGSEAERLMKERQAKKRARKGLPPLEEEINETSEEPVGGQRVQPKRKDRQKKAVRPVDTTDSSSSDTSADDTPNDNRVGLSKEEIARRRYERRARERQAAAQRRKEAQKAKRNNAE
ncbi:membrane protein insertase YidC [Actinomyces vulturis]|uniref:membrane protein insertase YidC n=1 Tax=Actinomyces vulturis TaxID=1857645 RepID=UPI000832EC73|nr:membrane protein insertase YidC [Actinomyces vulturis]